MKEDIQSYLDRHERKELLRFLTCGSVDDGKSTLIGRLLHDTKEIYEDQLAAVKRDSAKHGTTGSGEVDLALLTDGLKAEREQGITIDVAYRYFSTDKRKFIIADTPGHEQYTRNMATGASNCQLAIILIDARHGVMQQTRRHSFIVSLLGIRHFVVAVNKMDLVGYAESRFEEIRQEYASFAAKLGVAEVTFIPISALRGDNIVDKSDDMPWYGGTTLLNHLETVFIASDHNLAEMRFPVQYVLRPNLNFRGFAGTVASGIIRKGDEVLVLPSRRKTKIDSIITYDGQLEEAFSPQAVTVTLEDEIDVSRGDVLVHSGSEPHLTDRIEAAVVWMTQTPLIAGHRYWLKQTTRIVAAEATAIRHGIDVNTIEKEAVDHIAMNEIGQIAFTLGHPIAFDAYKTNPATGAFILIDRMTNNTVGAGMIVEPPERLAGDHWEQMPAAGYRPERQSPISTEDREKRFGQKAFTLLIHGRPGSGKGTIAYQLEQEFFDAGRLVTVLYGTNLRQRLSRDLGFSAEDRSENLRRSIEVAKLMNEAGMIAICAFVAPHESIRQRARELVGKDRFVEIYLSCPEDVCRTREGHDKGYIEEHEPAASADLTIDTSTTSVESAVKQIISFLSQRF